MHYIHLKWKAFKDIYNIRKYFSNKYSFFSLFIKEYWNFYTENSFLNCNNIEQYCCFYSIFDQIIELFQIMVHIWSKIRNITAEEKKLIVICLRMLPCLTTYLIQ